MLTRGLTFQGRIALGQELAVSADADAYLSSVTIRYGQQVAKGQLLVALDSHDADAQSVRLTGEQQAARQWLDTYYPAAIAALDLTWGLVRAEGDKTRPAARATVEALQRGLAQHLAEPAELAAAKDALDKAQAALRLGMADVELKKATLDQTRLEQQQHLVLAGTEIAGQQTTARHLRIQAPFSGTITGISQAVVSGGGLPVRQGQYLFTISDLDDRIVQLAVGQDQLQDFLPGRQISCRLKRLRIDLDCSAISAQRAGEDPNYVLQLRLQNPPAGLEFGDAVSVSLVLQSKAATIAVPLDTVRSDPGGQSVVVRDAKRDRLQPVLIGFRGDDQVEILAGLRAGDRVVTRKSGSAALLP